MRKIFFSLWFIFLFCLISPAAFANALPYQRSGTLLAAAKP